jgi:hypothetical protein
MMSRGFFTELKADPGKLGLETLLSEITKLKSVRAIGCRRTCSPTSPSGASPGGGAAAPWCSRPPCAATTPPPVMLTLLAVLCWCRLTEVTD